MASNAASHHRAAVSAVAVRQWVNHISLEASRGPSLYGQEQEERD